MSLLQRTRAAVWAAGVELRARKCLTAVERDYIAGVAPDRIGLRQPQAWTRYVRGKLTPLPPGSKKPSPISWAEKSYPGTQAPYNSMLWMLLQAHKAGKCIEAAWPKIVDGLDPEVLRNIDADNWLMSGHLLPRLGTAGFLAAVDESHLDAFAILLFQVCRSPIYEPPTKPLVYSALWLQRWSRRNPLLRRSGDLFLQLLGAYLEEFAFLRDEPTAEANDVDDAPVIIDRRVREALRKLVNADDNQVADRIAADLLDETFFDQVVDDTP